MFVICSYYLVRERLNTGYLSAVWDQELSGRYGSKTGAQGVDNTFWYYWNYLAGFRFRRWSYLLPVVPLAYLLIENKTVKNWLKFSSLLAVSYFLLISFSGTRNLWYDSQLYPFISILVGVSVLVVIKRLPLALRILAVAALCFLVFRLIKSNLEYIHQPDIDGSNSCVKYGYLLRDRSYSKEDYIWIHNRELYCMPFIFYAEKEGIKTKLISDISVGDVVLSCDAETLKSIGEKFSTLPAFDNRAGCLGVSIVK